MHFTPHEMFSEAIQTGSEATLADIDSQEAVTLSEDDNATAQKFEDGRPFYESSSGTLPSIISTLLGGMLKNTTSSSTRLLTSFSSTTPQRDYGRPSTLKSLSNSSSSKLVSSPVKAEIFSFIKEGMTRSSVGS